MISPKISTVTAMFRAVAASSLSLSILMAEAVAIAVSPAPVFAARDLLFLGVTDVKGAPAQPELEGELRAEFAADRRFRLIGEVETERVVREMERRGRTRAEGIIPPSAGLSDSAVVVRGVVTEQTIVIKRSPLLLWGKLDAKMRLEMIFYEVSGPLSQRGEFSASASKTKDVVLFQDPKKTVHVSVKDREELLTNMRAALAKDAVGFATTVFNALATGGVLPRKAAPKDSADTAAAQFSTPDGKNMAPIDSAGGAAPEGGK
jgi:hypothetical protein